MRMVSTAGRLDMGRALAPALNELRKWARHYLD